MVLLWTKTLDDAGYCSKFVDFSVEGVDRAYLAAVPHTLSITPNELLSKLVEHIASPTSV